MPRLTQQQATELVFKALSLASANETMAQTAAQALVRAHMQGLGSHGLHRVSQYCAHLRNGRANGAAVPAVIKHKSAALLIDAGGGLAFGACELAVREAVKSAAQHGACVAGVVKSHHAGVMVDYLRPVAEAGMVGLAFSNTPAAMPVAGGKHAVLGTNPIAAIFPRRTPNASFTDPLMMDLSLSEVARGKVMVAAKEGKPIPATWALDASGKPTTDAQTGLDGMMQPLGGMGNPKGAILGLMVELLVSAMLGANFSFEADSFFKDEGNSPNLGQAFIVIDPSAFGAGDHGGSNRFYDRIEVLVREMEMDEGVRLSGAHRLALEREAIDKGFDVSDDLYQQLIALAG